MQCRSLNSTALLFIFKPERYESSNCADEMLRHTMPTYPHASDTFYLTLLLISE